MNFHCNPATIDGVRRLAFIAATLQDIDTVDRLELAAINILKIEPEIRLQRDETYRLSGLVRDQPRGLLLKWTISIGVHCLACSGDGELIAYGNNGREFTFDCPQCDGTGDDPEGEERDLYTDIDGKIVEDFE